MERVASGARRGYTGRRRSPAEQERRRGASGRPFFVSEASLVMHWQRGRQRAFVSGLVIAVTGCSRLLC